MIGIVPCQCWSTYCDEFYRFWVGSARLYVGRLRSDILINLILFTVEFTIYILVFVDLYIIFSG